jgi:zinc protease
MPTKVGSVEGMNEYVLENGMKVLLFADKSQPKVTVNCTIFVGSRHEGYGETGMAHLLEHMVFKGTELHPEIPAALRDRGAVFNGTTWLDRTNYYETLPASDDNLEFAIRLEADRMVNSKILNEDLQKEFTVVRSEFERGENNPIRVLQQRMFSAAYQWHNYGNSTIGNRSDIERVPIDNLQAFSKRRRHWNWFRSILVLCRNRRLRSVRPIRSSHRKMAIALLWCVGLRISKLSVRCTTSRPVAILNMRRSIFWPAF